MKLPVLALIAALLVMFPQAAYAATLDGAAMRWPFALPFAGLLLSIALGNGGMTEGPDGTIQGEPGKRSKLRKRILFIHLLRAFCRYGSLPEHRV